MTLGQFEALVNIIGGMEAVQAVLSGELDVELKQAVIKWFDKHGRRIPPRTLLADVTPADTNYHLVQPALDYALRFDRLVKHLHLGREISLADFGSRAEAILRSLRQGDNAKPLLNGVYLPFCLPKVEVTDYGKVLDEMFLPAVGASYKQRFPKRNFNNYCEGKLAGQVTVIPGSRHEQLVAAMAKGVVVGIYFPNCLQGFSVDAAREQMTALQEQFLLVGGFEASACMIAYPDILARDNKTPILDLAALQWLSTDDSLHFGAGCDSAGLDGGRCCDFANGRHAGGLVVLG